MADIEDEVAEIDTGLAPGNYFNYADADVALQAEIDILDDFEGYYCDAAFPADGRAMYFDPLHPPKGALPGVSIKWNRICAGEVMDCAKPVFCTGRPSSPMIVQGAVGDSHFINCLRLLACKPESITGLLVSDKWASRGMYTFKFYKAGQWRYVHIDDRIACRQSGKVNFARNEDPNETFAMLVEKAYAKLHGCYEAIVHGMLERTMLDLTPAADFWVRRNEVNQDLDTIVDRSWDLIGEALKSNKMLGCGRWVPDPYCERLADRQGVTVGCMYQIIAIQEVTAAPTEDLDALTVGMVCIRNLQKDTGFFNGKWSIGHQYWTMYRDIGVQLRHKTREIMYARGLGPDPNEKNEDDELVNFVKDDEFFDARDRTGIDAFLALEQPDEPDAMTAAFLGRANLLSPQPYEKDLCWVQIEDFVDIFNRLYILTDLRFGQKKPLATKKYFSKWMPGDFVCGSGGPPLLLADDYNPDEENRLKRVAEQQQRDKDLSQSISLVESAYQEAENDKDDNSLAIDMARKLQLKQDVGQFASGAGSSSGSAGGARNDLDAATAAGAAAQSQSQGIGIGGGDGVTTDGNGNVIPLPDKASSPEGPPKAAKLPAPAPGPDQDITDGAGFAVYEPEGSDDDDEGGKKSGEGGADGADSSSPYGPYKAIDMNEDFTDNPMYPFSATEPCTICVALYQPDRRWSVGRLGEEPREILSSAFASRGERLASCMRYGNSAVGFVIVKLFGMKNRCTDFKLRKVVACSDSLSYGNVCSASATLMPGRYAIIPYTNKKVLRATNYILHLHFTSGSVETEVNDVLKERLMDDIVSDDESVAGEEEEEEELPADLTPEQLDVLEEQRAVERQKKKFNDLVVKPPLPWAPQPWEYLENIEDLGVVSVFDEVGDLARYMNNLHVEINKLKHTIDTLTLHYNGPGGAAGGDKAATPADKKRPSSKLATTSGSRAALGTPSQGKTSPSRK